MKALVLGGTGAMGMHLTRLLADGGYDVCVTTRQARENAGRIRYARGDAHDGAFLSELLAARYDCIIDFMAYSTQEFERRVRQLLDACAQYVFLSSSRVYARSLTPLTEDSPRLLDASDDAEYLATDEYALAKARQENLLTASGKQNFTIIRPYITYAENRLQLGTLEKETWLFRALSGRTVVLSREMLERKTTLTYGLDVARGIYAVMGNEQALGEVFHITQREARTWREVWEIYKPVIESYTQRPAELIAVEPVQFAQICPAKYQIAYDRLYDRVFVNTKISRLVDTASFTAPETGLARCLGAFIERGARFLYTPASAQGRTDRLTHEFSLAGLGSTKNILKYLIRRMGI